MKTLWNEVWSLCKKAWFCVPLLLTALLAYGFSLTHTIINMDDLASAFYLDDMLYARVGRPFWWLLEYVTQVFPVDSFVTGLVGLLLLLLAAACYCVLLSRASGDQLQKPAYPIFACLFLSYPMHFESWLCDRNCLMFGVAYLFVALALILMESYFRSKRRVALCGATLLMICVMFLYESFLLVYICGVFAVLLLYWVYGAAENRKISRFVTNGLLCVIPLVVAYAVKAVAFPGATSMHGAFDLENRVKTLLIRWVLIGKWSFSVQIFWGAVAAALLAGITLAVRERRASILLLLAGLLVSPFLLDIAIGSLLPQRAYQAVPFFVAFAGVLLCVLLRQVAKKQWLRTGCYALLFFLCFRQAVDMDRSFVLAERAYNEELTTARGVYSRLITEFTLDKPVQFVGLYMPDETILEQCAVTKEDPVCRLILDLMDTDAEWYRYTGAGLPYHFQWCLDTFGDYDAWAYDHPGNMFEAFFAYHGLRGLTVGTRDTYEAANRDGVDMPVWPAKGSICDMGDYILVKLGEIWIPPDSGTPLYTGDARPIT